MKVITLNCNGIRASIGKGLIPWLKSVDADIILMQEVRADLKVLQNVCQVEGYHCVFNPAEKKGYSGTAVLSKKQAKTERIRIDIETMDNEGRWCEVNYNNLSFVSIYLPSGSSGELAQAKKDKILVEIKQLYKNLLSKCHTENHDYVIAGDYNIAHTEMDIKNWRGNKKNSGFLPHEREWLSELFACGWVDVFRQLHPKEEAEGYSWWSNRGKAWENNTGWRIDYQIASPRLAQQVQSSFVYKEARFSDHAPVITNYQTIIE